MRLTIHICRRIIPFEVLIGRHVPVARVYCLELKGRGHWTTVVVVVDLIVAAVTIVVDLSLTFALLCCTSTHIRLNDLGTIVGIVRMIVVAVIVVVIINVRVDVVVIVYIVVGVLLRLVDYRCRIVVVD